ncbi:MFS transporter [Dactylosporangium sp. NPDC005572]|uniref:MFS transporter n=1 Tax=Dactylosporangium sp. NPDC005572 TaxID=3156889 RepID=UPI0033B9A16D
MSVRYLRWLSALRWAPYRRVWSVWMLQQSGYWFSSIAFQWLVARATDSDALTLSVLYFCLLLPMLLVSLPAGVLADTHDRRRIVLVAQSAILLVSTTTATLVLLGLAPVPVLMACAFAVGTAHSLAQPSTQALVANAVPVDDLGSAVVLQSIAMNLARIGGPALAGVLILYRGAVESLAAYGVIGLVALVIMRFVRPVATRPPAAPRQRLAARIGSGLRHARSRPPAWTALAIVAVTATFAIAYVAQLPTVAGLVSDDPGLFLVLTSVTGVGSLVGVLVVALRPSSGPSVTPPAALLAALGAVVVGLGVNRLLWLEYLLVAVGGALQFAIMTQCNSVIQQVVDDDHRGRVMSLYTMCWGGLLPVGGLVLGVSWHFLGPLVALACNGVIALAFAGWVLRPGAARTRAAAAQPALIETA